MGSRAFFHCIWSSIDWCYNKYNIFYIFLVLFEGKPTIPNAGEYWRIVEKYRVNGMYSSPTALRSLRREDPNGDWIKKFDISSLHSLSMAGERCDVPTY